MNRTQDQAHLVLQEAAKSSCPHDQHRRTWDEQEVLSLNRDKFDSDKHLVFSPPEWRWNLAEIELGDVRATSSFAVSGNFPLFSAAAVEKMREELLTDEVRHTIQTSSSILRRQLRGMVPEYVQHSRRRDKTDQIFTRHAEFTHNAWKHPKTLAAISNVAGIDLVPVMDIEISRVEILRSNSVEHSVGWHLDDYPYACVLVLSDTTHITEGHTLLKTGSGAILVCDCQKMVSLFEISSLAPYLTRKGFCLRPSRSLYRTRYPSVQRMLGVNFSHHLVSTSMSVSPRPDSAP
jgi:hypothetical protein